MVDPTTWQFAPWTLLASLVLGYMLGAVPFGLILTRAAGLGDVRAIGSGNIGATNVLRTGNKGLAAATLALDALKGTAAVLIAGRWGPEAALAAGLGALLGHIFPVWLRFKGGKGVATYIGALAAVAWPAAFVFAAVWLVMATVFRFSSLAALVALIAVPPFLALYGLFGAALVFAAMSLIAVAMHRQNIARLLAGTESRIGAKARA